MWLNVFTPSVLALVVVAGVLPGGVSPVSAPACREGLGGVDFDEFDCQLRNGSVTVQLERSLRYVRVDCEGGGFDCDELPRLAQLSGREVSDVVLKSCVLPSEGVACTLDRLGATGGGSFLRLDYVPGGALSALRPSHLAHLPLRTLLVFERPGWGRRVAPPAALGAAPGLTQLVLIGTDLTLAPDAFAVVPVLERLKLAGCGLPDLPPGAFRGLARLRQLVVFKQAVERVPAGAFEGLDALVELDLSECGVRELAPDAFAPLANLRVLHLINNRLTELDSRLLTGLGRLEELVVQNKVELQVGPAALASLPALRSIRMTRCRLRALPADVLTASAAVEHLDLSWNSIERLSPDHFRDQKNLRTLNLTHNLLEELPTGLFSGLAAVEEINLSHNRLRELAPGAFRGARSLLLLRLAHNALTLVPSPLEYAPRLGPSPLADLPGLRLLDLAHNNVSALSDDWRISMTTLALLNLSHNDFTYLVQDMDFNFAQENITVDLRYNKIRAVLQTPLFNVTAAYTTSSAEILLDGNPFACDCWLHRFLAWQRDRAAAGGRRPDLAAARCAEPVALRGEALSGVRLDELRCAATPCPAGCSCSREPASLLLRVACAGPPAPADVDRLMSAADAEGYAVALRLDRPPSPDFVLHRSVIELDLAGLGLATVPPAAFQRQLTSLDLSNNLLPAVPAELLTATGPRLRFAGNPLECDCEYAAEVGALQQRRARVADYDRLNCSSQEPLALKDAGSLCAARKAAVIGGSLAALGALLVLAALLAFLCRRELYYLALRLGLWRDADGDKPYDAFVSFCHRDHWFVVEQLVARLEGGARPLRLCLHYRDWLGGAWVPEQIARSVRDSRRTLLVLSEHYLRSRWSLLEFRAAAECALRENRVRLVVVMLRDVTSDPQMPPDLRAYLRVNTYLVWGEPDFWRRLRAALPPPRPGGGPPAPDKLSRPPLAAEWLTAAGDRVDAGSPPAL